MKKLLLLASLSLSCIYAMAEKNMKQDTTSCYHLEEVSVVSFYRTDVKVGNVVNRESLLKFNKGQEPSFILNSRPSVFAYSDTGNEYGYAYFRMRGMDQTRVNMTMDGMPLNEGEDMGVYFSNYPDMIASMHSVKVESGAGITGNGVAGYAGTIDFESVNLKRDTISSVYMPVMVVSIPSKVAWNTIAVSKANGLFTSKPHNSNLMAIATTPTITRSRHLRKWAISSITIIR